MSERLSTDDSNRPELERLRQDCGLLREELRSAEWRLEQSLQALRECESRLSIEREDTAAEIHTLQVRLHALEGSLREQSRLIGLTVRNAAMLRLRAIRGQK